MRNKLHFYITFGSEHNSASHELYGWQMPEPSLTWSRGNESAVMVPQITSGSGIGIELMCGSFNIPGMLSQTLILKINGQSVGRPTPITTGTYAWVTDPTFHMDKALVITLAYPNAGSPVDFQFNSDDRVLAIAAFRLRVFVLEEKLRSSGHSVCDCGPDDVGNVAQRLTGMSAGQLSMEFESLGDNCELGLIQRQLGAEPLGLLRFSAATLPHVLRGVETDFAGIGCRLSTAMEGKEREWMVRDPDYDLRWHTFLLADQATEEGVLARETKKTTFLHKKFLRDVDASEKIFVVKSREHQAEPEEIMALHLALNRRAANWLLWVTLADHAHPPCSVKEIAPRLLHGRIRQFSNHLVANDEDVPGWLALMINAWLSARGRGQT